VTTADPGALNTPELATQQPAAADGKIYPKCLPKHAIQVLSSDAATGGGSNSQSSSNLQNNINNNNYNEQKAISDNNLNDIVGDGSKNKSSTGDGRISNGLKALTSAVVAAVIADEDNEDIPFSQDRKKIVFTKIEDIPTRPDSPPEPQHWPPLPPSSPPPPVHGITTEVQQSRKKFERNTFVAAGETRKKGDGATQYGINSGGGNSSATAAVSGTPRLKFGLNMAGNKTRLLQASAGAVSTFAELSNKLGPLGHRKNGLRQQQQQQQQQEVKLSATTTFMSASDMVSSSGRLPPLKEHIRQIEEAVAAEVASTAAAVAAVAAVGGANAVNGAGSGVDEADAATDVVDMELEESFQSSKNRRQLGHGAEKEKQQFSRSRSDDGIRGGSRSASRSPARSWSRGRRSRSRSRSYSYSRSPRSAGSSSYSSSSTRSRSFSSYSSSSSYSYSSRSRSRTRSPSIQRRRGSPSFLDKRRITR
jgi:hypothetical protein